MYLAPGVERVLLMTSLAVSRDPVLVPQSPVYEMVLPPMGMWVWLGSAFVVRTLQMTQVCAISLRRLAGMSWNYMGFIVFVPAICCVLDLFRCLPTPCQSRPTSFA